MGLRYGGYALALLITLVKIIRSPLLLLFVHDMALGDRDSPSRPRVGRLRRLWRPRWRRGAHHDTVIYKMYNFSTSVNLISYVFILFNIKF